MTEPNACLTRTPRANLLSRMLDFIAPRRCVGCSRRLLPNEDELCASCIIQLDRSYFWKRPRENHLWDILSERNEIEKAAAWLLYRSDKDKQAIWALKYYGHDNAGIILGFVMAKEMLCSGFFDGIEALVPLPLAKNRQRQRGYNQSRMIALGVHRATGIPIVDNALWRARFTQSQTRLSHAERKVNVEKQFSVIDDSNIRNKHILVIDDVITTGSTVSACISPLSYVEGVKISVLSLAYAGT